MSDTQARLVRCFRAVFPDLPEGEIVKASAYRMGNWDSVVTVTLVAAVEEEFAMQFEADELEGLNSFERFLSRVIRLDHGAAGSE